MLSTLAWISIVLAVLCAGFIAMDEWRRPQAMGVMNLVWPVTALYFSVFALWAYLRVGRHRAREAMQHTPMKMRDDERKPPSLLQIALGTSHCGAGCMIADLLTDFAIAAGGLTLLGSVLWTEYVLDFAAAWALGIAFQYFAIRPMRPEMTAGQVIAAAVKADTLSILAFQVGMYAWMALVFFRLFRAPHLTPFDPRYWLMMQAGMICGFATSLPMNYLLIRAGIKEKM